MTLTQDLIDGLAEGDELDALVASLVTGWKCDDRHCDGVWKHTCGSCGRTGHGNCYGNGTGAVQVPCTHRPGYSCDDAAAWQVVEKMTETHDFSVTKALPDYQWGGPTTIQKPECIACFTRRTDQHGSCSKSDSLPLSVCKAALMRFLPDA